MRSRIGAYARQHHLALVSLFVALGGTSYAVVGGIPGRDGRLHGCYQKRSGALRLVKQGKACRKSERAIAWSQVGPRGTAGAPGQPGAKGDPGPIGPSDAFAAARVSGPTGINTTATPIATLASLPAGSYTIVAKTELHSDINTDVLCKLVAGSDTDSADAFVGPSGAAGAAFVDVLSTELVHTFTATGQAQLVCQRDLAATVTVSNTRIIATKLASATSVDVTG